MNMADLNDVTDLKRLAEQLQRDVDKAQGALESALKRIKQEHGCGNLKAAKMKLKALMAEEKEAEAKFQKAYQVFERDHGDLLRTDNDA